MKWLKFEGKLLRQANERINQPVFSHRTLSQPGEWEYGFTWHGILSLIRLDSIRGRLRQSRPNPSIYSTIPPVYLLPPIDHSTLATSDASVFKTSLLATPVSTFSV
jgi:hypothetical protein